MNRTITTDRIVALDFVRGIAVLGILLMNVLAFALPEAMTVSPRAPGGPAGPRDDWTWLVLFVLVEGKFRGLFSLLFGASMALFVERAEAEGRDGDALQRRRLGWLALFGLLHFFLLWRGDILFLYAACGFLVLAMRDAERGELIAGALIVYAGGAAALGALGWLGTLDPQAEAREAARLAAEAREETALLLSSWPEIVAHRVRHWVDPLVTLAFTLCETIPLMMLGMVLYRDGLFDLRWSAARLRRWAIVGFLAGLALTVPLAWWIAASGFALDRIMALWLGPAAFGRLAMTLAYAALFALLARQGAASWVGRRIVACGRMAFSNYIGTSLLMTCLFYGWGFALFGRFDRFELMAFVLLGWVAMLAWSASWLVRFRFGPLEWLWRSLTYGRIGPLRR